MNSPAVVKVCPFYRYLYILIDGVVLQEQGGELVGVLRGANAPLLQRMIVQKLSEEKMVLEKGGERKVVSCEISTCTTTHVRLTLFDSFEVFCVFQIKDGDLGEDEQKEDEETQPEDNIIGKRFI